jgi:hypothetical protein
VAVYLGKLTGKRGDNRMTACPVGIFPTPIIEGKRSPFTAEG